MNAHFFNPTPADFREEAQTNHRLAAYEAESKHVIGAAQTLLREIRALAMTAEEVNCDPKIGDMHASEWIEALDLVAADGVAKLEDMR